MMESSQRRRRPIVLLHVTTCVLVLLLLGGGRATTFSTSTNRRRRRPASWFVKDSLLHQHHQRYRQHHHHQHHDQQQNTQRQGRSKKHRTFPKPRSKEYRPHAAADDDDAQRRGAHHTAITQAAAAAAAAVVPSTTRPDESLLVVQDSSRTTTITSNKHNPLFSSSLSGSAIITQQSERRAALQQTDIFYHSANGEKTNTTLEEEDVVAEQPHEQQHVHHHQQQQQQHDDTEQKQQQQQQQEKLQNSPPPQQQEQQLQQRYRRVVIEGSTRALFFCPECEKALQAEQDVIWKTIAEKYNTDEATLIRAKQHLINALFVRIPILSLVDKNKNRNLQEQQQEQNQQQYIQLDLENNDKLMDERVDDDTREVDQWLQSLPGVVRVSHSQDYQAMDSSSSIDSGRMLKRTTTTAATRPRAGEFVDDIDRNGNEAEYPTIYDVADYLGSTTVRSSESSSSSSRRQGPCLTGQGIRVAVLDTGVDYTHSVFKGGDGTERAYQRAYGSASTASENTDPQSYFPTSQVVAGIDYVGDGERLVSLSDLHPDADPIDSPTGHGTKVASAIVATAPNVELIAIKVCSNIGSCPDFAMVDGLEFAIRQGAKIANLSLGRWYTSSYYSITAKAIEDAFQLGLTTIVAAGNEDNIPWVIGGISAVPNAITIGSTLAKAPTSRMSRPTGVGTGTMASYSSRGPGSNNMIKPDLSAPGGSILFARSGSGSGGVVAQGTSFAAPFVAGAAALLLEKCGPSICSPFSLKAILMNTAKRTTRYHEDDGNLLAPISWVGSGEMAIEKAVQAEFWAYSVEDVQPSLSLGLHNIVEDIVLTRTIRIVNMQGSQAHDLSVSYQFRDYRDELSGAMTVHIAQTTVSLASSDCSSLLTNQVDVSIEFRIHAANVPSNYMTASGMSGANPAALDRNEFDGWIVIQSNNDNSKDISLPFLALLRKASQVRVGIPNLPELTKSPQFIPINMFNSGAGMAQIDSYELLHISEDDPEGERGSGEPSADFRFVGYQTREVNEPNCEYIIEFAFTLWEAKRRPVNTQHEVRIDIDGDFKADYILANRAQQYHKTIHSECRVQDTTTGEWKCAGFPPDHSTNTANTIIRACSNDIGIKAPATLNVGFSSVAFPAITKTADSSPAVRISVPATSLAAPSYDIAPGETLSHMMVTGSTDVRSSLGLLLITNAFRSASSTGSATRETEAIALVFEGVKLPREITPDVLIHPVASTIHGPDCRWKDASSRRRNGECLASTITSRRRLVHPTSDSKNATTPLLFFRENILEGHDQQQHRRDQSSVESCPEYLVPRVQLASSMPSQAPSMTDSPTIEQTPAPSTPRPTQSPTLWRPPTQIEQHDLPSLNTAVPIRSPVPPHNSQPEEGDEEVNGQEKRPHLVALDGQETSAAAVIPAPSSRSCVAATTGFLIILALVIV